MSFSVLLLAQRLRRSVNGERANVSRRPFGTETVSSRVRRGTERSAYAYKRSDTKRITDGAVVDPRAFRRAPHRGYKSESRFASAPGDPGTVGRRHANAHARRGTVAVSRGASDGRVCVRPAVRVPSGRARWRTLGALGHGLLARSPSALRYEKCLRASADCGYFVSGSSQPSCDVKYNRNRCGGGRACGGAYWN